MPKAALATDGTLLFWCPACNKAHGVNVSNREPLWQWNGSLDQPTISPSIRVRNGHYSQPDQPCWCTYEERHGEKAPFHCYHCHSFVVDGKIQFCADSSHKMAGQTVELPEWDRDSYEGT